MDWVLAHSSGMEERGGSTGWLEGEEERDHSTSGVILLCVFAHFKPLATKK